MNKLVAIFLATVAILGSIFIYQNPFQPTIEAEPVIVQQTAPEETPQVVVLIRDYLKTGDTEKLVVTEIPKGKIACYKDDCGFFNKRNKRIIVATGIVDGDSAKKRLIKEYGER